MGMDGGGIKVILNLMDRTDIICSETKRGENKMSEFGKAINEKDDFYPEDFPFLERETDYYSKFVNQYIKIPDSISNKVESLYSSEKPALKRAVKHCIKLLVTNG